MLKPKRVTNQVRAELEMTLVRPILHPERFERLGIATPGASDSLSSSSLLFVDNVDLGVTLVGVLSQPASCFTVHLAAEK